MKLINELQEAALREEGLTQHIQTLAESKGQTPEQFIAEQTATMTTVNSVEELFAAIGWSND